jgi:hypothetical protein
MGGVFDVALNVPGGHGPGSVTFISIFQPPKNFPVFADDSRNVLAFLDVLRDQLNSKIRYFVRNFAAPGSMQVSITNDALYH